MHIVIVNRWPRFKDSQRWDNELTRYEEFFDHHAHRISYVVDGPGSLGVLTPRAHIAHLVQVEDVNQYSQLLAAVSEVVERVGPVDLLIALSEFTLEIAAKVRKALNIPGQGPEQVAVYRDKARMKQIVRQCGIPVPAFIRCESIEHTLAFAEQVGYPLIVKPVDGAASMGVARVDSAEQLRAALQDLDLQRYEVETFINGQVYHVDGYTDAAGQIPFQAVSRYLNSCLDFAHGHPLGSVLLQRSPLRTRIETFSRQCSQALGLYDTAFHLELFVCPDESLVFLEVGARVGGSEVPHLINKVFGVNLYEHWLKHLVGGAAELPAPQGDPCGGWLIIPKPQRVPSKVLKAPSQRGQVASLWRELLPQPGQILDAGGGYDSLQGGRFIFTGLSQPEIERDIQHVIDHYRLEAQPI
ncbi:MULTISPECIES: ATP-grasp domain-containing protein [Pseudomonas]|uniref:ATP-grasp domain-containing protein n=1 Tax=Pseudomonas promysalinigenes TaxID=485898 RepID=A0ABY6AG90_9PSED|nr:MULTISPECIES: ATP-grasp domain-containing protein [Pseudomonas]UXH38037.1 ATP-grasp domain-containing protein [Pseudomonas promysalinigenes]